MDTIIPFPKADNADLTLTFGPLMQDYRLELRIESELLVYRRYPLSLPIR